VQRDRVRDGVSVDTTMGLTPLDGLVMGTRSGDVDPGLLSYLAGRTGMGVDELTRALNVDSGLQGCPARATTCAPWPEPLLTEKAGPAGARRFRAPSVQGDRQAGRGASAT
jgi:hypothetical protein